MLIKKRGLFINVFNFKKKKTCHVAGDANFAALKMKSKAIKIRFKMALIVKRKNTFPAGPGGPGFPRFPRSPGS